MTGYSSKTQRSRKASSVDPSRDPVGAFLVKQRPEVAPGIVEPPHPSDASERITDHALIGSLLASVSNLADGAEDDLIFELLYLETLLAARPLRSNDLLEQLGALGEEVREGLLPPGTINMIALRRRTRRLKQHIGGMASRASAAMLMLFTTLPLFGQQAAAAEPGDISHNTFQIAAAPVVRVIDSLSGAGLAGVTIKSMEEKVLGVTDGAGQATLSEDYRDTDLMSLEKNGYELSLLERSQLAARNIVSMKPIKEGAQMATKPTAPVLRPPVAAIKPPVAPTSGTPPKMTMANNTPHLEAPKPPMAPKAPQIRLPAKPRQTGHPAMAAKPHPAMAKPQGAAPMMAAGLPTHPKPPAANAGSNQMAAAPILAAPSIDTPKAPAGHAMAKPNLPSVHAGKGAAARAAAMGLPAHPRKPMMTAARPQSAHQDAVSVMVPKRTPRAMHSAHHPHGSAGSAGHGAYQVKPGDTLSKLAHRYLGSAKRWPELYAMNRGRVHNPALIRVGQVLNLPSASSMATGRSRSYVVRPGDSLSKIASQQMGNATRWVSIYNMNKDHLHSARMIFPGQTLTLPV